MEQVVSATIPQAWTGYARITRVTLTKQADGTVKFSETGILPLYFDPDELRRALNTLFPDHEEPRPMTAEAEYRGETW